MKYSKIILISLLSLGLWSCDTHNILHDIGSADGEAVTANVFLDNVAPKLAAGSTVTVEVQYWSLDDQFQYTGLWNVIQSIKGYAVSIGGIEFQLNEENDESEWTEVKEYAFDFANWTPASNAYIHDVEYYIDPAYDKVTLDKSDITGDEFITSLPEGYEESAYDFYATALDRDVLNTLMIDNNIMTQSEFDTQYGENGSLTDTGELAIANGLEQIGLKSLMSDTYKVAAEYEITLAFRVLNGTQKSNEAKRSFGVF